MLDEISALKITAKDPSYGGNEIGAYLYEANGEVHVGKKVFPGETDKVQYGEQDETSGKLVGTVHYHQNSTGPSPKDVMQGYNAGENKMNAVVIMIMKFIFIMTKALKWGILLTVWGILKIG